MAKSKLIRGKYGISARPNVTEVKCPNRVVQDATLSIRTIANHYVRGLMDGINVHQATYSTELTPITAKGVDLCDYSAIQQYSKQLAETSNEALKTEAIKLVRESKKKSKSETPPKEE